MCKNSESTQQDVAVADTDIGRYRMNQCNAIIVLSKISKTVCFIMDQ